MRFQRHTTGRFAASWLNGSMVVYPGYQADAEVYFVDGANGNDLNNGLTWERPVATIQRGLDLARFRSGTIVVNNDKNHHAFVFVAPGHYNEQVLFSGYNIHLIGCSAWPGKDYGVSINYDNAVGAPAALAFSGSGIELANLYVNIGTANYGIWCAGGDNNWINNCYVECDGVLATYGIVMDSMKGSIIEDCVIERPITAGIGVFGGLNHYFIDGAIRHNFIHADTAGVLGIDVQAGNVCYNAVIDNNWIDVEGGGAASVGIVNANAANVQMTRNMIIVGAAATPIVTAGLGCIHNAVSINGAVTDPYGLG